MSEEESAKRKWNKEADEFNQWEDLDSDEKEKLIQRESTPTPEPIKERSE